MKGHAWPQCDTSLGSTGFIRLHFLDEALGERNEIHVRALIPGESQKNLRRFSFEGAIECTS